MKTKATLLATILFLMPLSCSVEDTATTADQTTLGGGSSNQGVDKLESDVNNAYENMIPGSLVLDTSSSLYLSDNPCENTDGLFDCQPNLLKLYINMSKQMLAMVKGMVTVSKGALQVLKTGTSGSLDITETGGPTKIEYNITSLTEYKLLLFNGTSPFLYLSVNGSVINAKGDSAKFPSEDGSTEENPAYINIDLNITDDDNFSIDSTIIMQSCNSNDIRSPSSMKMKVNKSSDLWTGKAMLYSSRWLYNEDITTVTCDTTPTDAMKMFTYTDFAGNDTNTTASLYMMPNSVSTVSDFSDYNASSFCTNYSDYCWNGYGFGDKQPISSYSNPFCATKTDATWNGACSDIGVDKFSSSDNWTTPAVLENETISLPTTIL